MWAKMSEKEKEPYVKLSEKDKARFERQNAEREKKGFFMLDDNSKSTDPENAKLFKRKKSAAEAEEEVVKQKAILYEVYTRKMADEAMRGVKKGAGPKKYEKPCRWMVGKDALASRARGEAPCCWAWDYIDPKTNKRMTPHTCPFQHPGEPGWHNEWMTNNRFDPSTKQLNRFAVIADAASKKNRM